MSKKLALKEITFMKYTMTIAMIAVIAMFSLGTHTRVFADDSDRTDNQDVQTQQQTPENNTVNSDNQSEASKNNTSAGATTTPTTSPSDTNSNDANQQTSADGLIPSLIPVFNTISPSDINNINSDASSTQVQQAQPAPKKQHKNKKQKIITNNSTTTSTTTSTTSPIIGNTTHLPPEQKTELTKSSNSAFSMWDQTASNPYTFARLSWIVTLILLSIASVMGVGGLSLVTSNNDSRESFPYRYKYNPMHMHEQLKKFITNH